MGTHVNRLQKTFGKTPVSFSSQAKALDEIKTRQLLIGLGFVVALAGGIYIGYRIRKKWWPHEKPDKDPPTKTDTKADEKAEPKFETYSNFSGRDKLSRREKRAVWKRNYFAKRNRMY